MAHTVEQILKEIIGQYVIQIAQLQSQVETIQEQIVKLTPKLENGEKGDK